MFGVFIKVPLNPIKHETKTNENDEMLISRIYKFRRFHSFRCFNFVDKVTEQRYFGSYSAKKFKIF